MLTKIVCLLFICTVLVNGSVLGEYYTNADDNYNSSSSNKLSEKSINWLKGAQNVFSSPTGHVMVGIAKELLNRSTGNSQVRSEVVLSLNLTNLLIILLLKILIFAAAILGSHYYGGYGGYGYGYGRSLQGGANDISLGLSDGEDYLITAFLAAQGSGVDDCLYTAACANPKISQKYVKAARALLEGIQKYEGSLRDPRYNDLIELVERATYDGLHGNPCNTTSNCNNIL